MRGSGVDGVCELSKHQLLLEEILIEGIQLCGRDGTLVVQPRDGARQIQAAVSRRVEQRRGISRLGQKRRNWDRGQNALPLQAGGKKLG